MHSPQTIPPGNLTRGNDRPSNPLSRFSRPTADHETFVMPARGYPQLWRVFSGLLLTLVVYLTWILAMLAVLWAVVGLEALGTWTGRMMTAETPTAVLLMLFTFVGMALGPMLAAKWLHRRNAHTLFGPAEHVTRGFFLGAGVVGGALALSLVIVDPGFVPEPNLNLSLWLSFLPLALVGVAIQTGAEEVLFRGYLQQQMAARFNSPLMWMLLPSVLFGLLHYDPASSQGNAWLIVGAATLFGLLAADLTRVTGNIGAAWGFHFANNCFALLIVGLDGTMSGLALYTTPFTAENTAVLTPLIFRDMAITLALWGLLRVLLRFREEE